MWNLLNETKVSESCSRFQDALEAAASGAPTTVSAAELVAMLTPKFRQHAASCAECGTATEEWLAARNLLRALPAQPKTSDAWFASRVMAAISAKEAELRRAGSLWLAVPRFASRVALFSGALIVVMSTWIYSRPVLAPALNNVSTESLFENSQPPATQDDILVSLAEKAR